MNTNNILFCVVGPSGAGKTTTMRSIMENELVSITTREMRDGETEGKDYRFITKEEHSKLCRNGELAENAEYDNNYYGLSKEELFTKLSKGHAFFICTADGMEQVKRVYSNVVSIFLYSDRATCINNMLSRGDSLTKAHSRLATYANEMADRVKCDYVIKNNEGTQDFTKFIVSNIVYSEIAKQEGLGS